MTHCFIDTHCHFDFPPFSGEETSSLARAAEAGVRAIIVPAIEAARFDKVLALAREHDALYAALGLHPIVIEHHLDDHLDRLDATLQNADTKLVAIGEIGLDLYREDPQFERQQMILDAQLRLAKRHDLPVILHSRRTHDVMAQLPLTSLLLETDAPDMPLNGFQGQPNRPEQAARVFDVLCELRQEPEDVIASALLENTRAVFGITL